MDGDINTVAGGNSVADDYEEGDINTARYEQGDVNAVGSIGHAADDASGNDEAPGHDETGYDESGYEESAGNRAEGGTPTAVLQYLARSLANEPEAVVIQAESRSGRSDFDFTSPRRTWDGSSAGEAVRLRRFGR